VLDIFNIWRRIMKISYLVFAIVALVLITVGFWVSNDPIILESFDIFQLLTIFILVGFGFLIGIRRFRSERRGQPSEDELSKKIMQKASSISYFISIYLWLGIMYISDKGYIATEELFGVGIIGMGLILFISWGIISFTGLRNE
jgi:peptidoglycan/LPS O-acetylase OafA/YrhL